MTNEIVKNCYKCGSNSTIEDKGKWVCFQHIDPCKCKKNHEATFEWDFNQSRGYADGYTIESMEYQSPTPDVPGYTEDGVWAG